MSLQDKIKNAEETMWPMTMGMSISEAISKLRYELPNNNKMANAYAVAIETMRKYQKIEQIVNEYNLQLWNNTSDGAYNFQRIREVLKDGNDK